VGLITASLFLYFLRLFGFLAKTEATSALQFPAYPVWGLDAGSFFLCPSVFDWLLKTANRPFIGHDQLDCYADTLYLTCVD